MHMTTFSRQPIMAEKAGYPCETHYVTTDDGYILQVKSPTSPPKTLSSVFKNQQHIADAPDTSRKERSRNLKWN